MKLTAALLWLSCAAFAQVAGDANRNYQTREDRREVAHGLLDRDREHDQKPAQLVASLPIRPGMIVADIGAGPGFMLPYLSRAVGPEGRVLAEDVFPDFIEAARKKADREHLPNITVILGSGTDPTLPHDSVDLAFMLEVYHHLDEPGPVVTQLRRALKPDGVLVIVEYYRRPHATPFGDPMKHIRADQPQVVREVESNGYHLIEKHDHIPHSLYVLIFRKDSGRHHKHDD